MPERDEQRNGTDSSNWIDGPYNRWGFLHVRELDRTARIASLARRRSNRCPDRPSTLAGFSSSTTVAAGRCRS